MTDNTNTSTNYINVMVVVRQYLLLISKLLGLSICIYFIYNAKHYEVNWNLLNWIAPSIVLKINNGLSYLGMYILIIPLSIILVSLVIPNNIGLNIVASFFGVSSTLFTVISGVFQNTLTQVYNMKFLVIYHILSMQEKRDIFIAEYKRIMLETYAYSIQITKLLQEHLSPKYFTIYDQKLKTLVDSMLIKIYANDVTAEIVKQYEISIIPKTPSNTMYYIKIGAIVIISIGIVLGGIAIVRYFTENNSNLLVTTQLAKETTVLAAESTQSQHNLGVIVQNLTQEVATLTQACTSTNSIVTTLSKHVEELQNNGLLSKQLFTKLLKTLKEKNVITFNE